MPIISLIISNFIQYLDLSNTIKEFCLIHLGSIGLILDMLGATILFFIVVSIGEQVVVIDPVERERRRRTKRNKEIFQKLGYTLIFLGFLLQLISNENALAK